MTGENTRLDGSEIDTKYRSEGRYNYPRRRATKISYSHSGSFESDLALAVQESLLMAKQAEAKKQAAVMEDSTNKQNYIGFPEEPKENPVTEKNCGENMQSSKCLKELLLINLDLVQHQQEMITQRDKEIKKLKSERDALQCRLDRMERRMSLLKQKEDSESTSPFAKAFIAHSARLGSPTLKKMKNEVTEESQSVPMEDRGMKRKANLEPQNLNKKLAVDAEMPKADRSEKSCGRLSWRGKRRTINQTAVDKANVESPSVCTNQKQKTCTVISSDYEENGDKSEHKKIIPSIIKGDGSEPILRTNDLYHVSYYEPIADQIDISSRNDIMTNAQAQLQVETPNWKPKKYPSLWVLEGTENLEDEVFLKRHQKCEIEEKRRKRWDLQRIREQKIYDKLREKDGGNHRKEDETLESFYPRLEDITHIEITDKIPVMAFGHPLPNLQSVNFELPWEITTKSLSSNQSLSSSSKQGRSSRHR